MENWYFPLVTTEKTVFKLGSAQMLLHCLIVISRSCSTRKNVSLTCLLRRGTVFATPLPTGDTYLPHMLAARISTQSTINVSCDKGIHHLNPFLLHHSSHASGDLEAPGKKKTYKSSLHTNDVCSLIVLFSLTWSYNEKISLGFFTMGSKFM